MAGFGMAGSFRQRRARLVTAIGSHLPHFSPCCSSATGGISLTSGMSLAVVRSVVSIGLGLGAATHASANIYTVTSSADDNSAGTLREQIAASSAGDTIQFAAALNGSTITLQQGQIPIDHALTVAGPGADKVTISGNNASRIFQIYNFGSIPPAVTISGLTLSAGNTAGNGGAIYALNIGLSVQNCVLSGNTAHFGGSIYAGGGTNATATLNNATLSGNSAASGGAFFLKGQSSVAIVGSTMTGNSTTTCCGGGYIGYAGSVTISSATIGTNTVSGANGNAGGMAFTHIGTSLQVSNSTISGNVSLKGHGGGLWITDSGAVVTNSHISGNSAYFGAGIYAHDDRATTSADITLAQDTVSGNTAVFYGGGIDANRLHGLAIGYSQISGNHATSAVSSIGGGIALRSTFTSANVHDTTIYGNYAYNRGGGKIGRASCRERV